MSYAPLPVRLLQFTTGMLSSTVVAAGCQGSGERVPAGTPTPRDPTAHAPSLDAHEARAPTAACSAPWGLGVHLVGRYGGCAPAEPIFSWSGTGLYARFSGTGLDITLNGPRLAFTVVVDGNVSPKLLTKEGRHVYPVVQGVPPGEHSVLLLKQNEASFGAAELVALDVKGGALLPATPPFSRRLEIIGDSITAGYGNEGASPSCPFSLETENHYLTYGAILARAFDAELSTVAWSGKGVVSNYGGNLESPMPTLYARAVGDDPTSVWDHARWVPDVVMINLGTNDYSTEHDPASDRFVAEYASLLATIRERYPNAAILCTLGPLLAPADAQVAEANIQMALEKRRAAGDTALSFHAIRVPNTNPGCDWHPGLATHAAMAEELKPVLAKLFAGSGRTPGP